MLKISDLNKLKITSITHVIHFKYENEYYFIHENWADTHTTAIYKGRTKYKTECLKSIYGSIPNLIIYKNNKNTLSSIDKEKFVMKLYRAGLIETDIQEIIDNVYWQNERCKELNKIIYEANEELRKINWG